jgi:hypothetical protein
VDFIINLPHKSAKFANDNKFTKIPQKVDFLSYKIMAKN